MTMSTKNQIELSSQVFGGVLLLRVAGRLDLLNAEQFENDTINIIKDATKDIIIHLEKVTYMSSSGVRALLAIYRYGKENGSRVSLCEASPVVRKVLEVVEMSQILTHYEKQSDAIDAWK